MLETRHHSPRHSRDNVPAWVDWPSAARGPPGACAARPGSHRNHDRSLMGGLSGYMPPPLLQGRGGSATAHTPAGGYKYPGIRTMRPRFLTPRTLIHSAPTPCSCPSSSSPSRPSSYPRLRTRSPPQCPRCAYMPCIWRSRASSRAEEPARQGAPRGSLNADTARMIRNMVGGSYGAHTAVAY